MGLALAIPVWNDEARLVRVLEQAAHLRCFDEVIVVDDGSDIPLEAGRLPRPAPLRLIRTDSPRGAGHARNRALAVTASAHVLFFDADDMLTPELAHLWHDLDGRDFDFCLFRHADTRVAARGLWGETAPDRALWAASGCAYGALSPVGRTEAPYLAETANYPWNKIYRTAFLVNNAIRCSETLVHNDIALHWLSFARADTILASDRVAAVHRVSDAGSRLTNRGGTERLAVFPELEQINRWLRGSPLIESFLRFCSHLLAWIRGVLDPDLHAAFDAAAARFLRVSLTPPVFDRMVEADPVATLRLLLYMGVPART